MQKEHENHADLEILNFHEKNKNVLNIFEECE